MHHNFNTFLAQTACNGFPRLSEDPLQAVLMHVQPLGRHIHSPNSLQRIFAFKQRSVASCFDAVSWNLIWNKIWNTIIQELEYKKSDMEYKNCNKNCGVSEMESENCNTRNQLYIILNNPSQPTATSWSQQFCSLGKQDRMHLFVPFCCDCSRGSSPAPLQLSSPFPGTVCNPYTRLDLCRKYALLPHKLGRFKDNGCEGNKTNKNKNNDTIAFTRIIPACEKNRQGNHLFFGIKYLYRIGEAKKPGPHTDKLKYKHVKTKPGQIVKVDIINITHLLNFGKHLAKRDFDVAFVNEHSVGEKDIHKAREIFGKNTRIELSKLDPEKSRNVGGVGMIQRGNKNIIMPNIKNKNLKLLCQQGRVGVYGMNIGDNEVAIVYAAYGHTGGEQSLEARSRTDELMSYVLQDMESQPAGPKFIVGDLNAEIHNLPSLHGAIQKGTLKDIGANSAKYGVPNYTPTCQANSNSKETRRDYILANKQADDLIHDFKVIKGDLFSVHSVLRLEIRINIKAQKERVVNLPKSIADVFNDVCKNVFTKQKLNNQNDTPIVKKQKADKAIIIDTSIPGKAKKLFPDKIREAEFEKNLEALQKEFDDEPIEVDNSDIPNEILEDNLNQLHAIMDEHLHNNREEFIHLTKNKNTQAYMELFAKCIEDATSQFGELDDIKRKAISGRSTINIKYVDKHQSLVHNEVTNDMESKASKQEQLMILQYRRLKHVKGCVIQRKKCADHDICKKARLAVEMHKNVQHINKDRSEYDGLDDIAEHFKENLNTLNFNVFKIELHENRILEKYDSIKNLISKHKKNDFNAKLNKANSHKQISQIIKNIQPASMSSMVRNRSFGPDKPKGSITTEFNEIDCILSEIWRKITNGAEGDPKQIANAFG